ncbi:UNVERIFIED_CONTAM: hypothetical protein K2H54_025519 [Gekko kuhli]
MAECRGEVVYQSQGSRIADCAAFDDEALIHSYDQAVHSFQETLGTSKSPAERRSSNESESDVEQEEEEEEEKEKEEEGRQWCIGDSCLAVWSGDGLLYPARIAVLDQDQGCCTVCFDGYGNEEEQLLAALLPPDWKPPEDEDAVRELGCLRKPNFILWLSVQEEPGDTSRFPEGRSNEDEGQANSRIPQPQKDEKPPLPPPPHGHNSEEALLSMLLAWHLSGYHTGYYVGLRQGRKEVGIAAPNKRPPQHPRVSEHR